MENWKTTLGGLLGALSVPLIYAPGSLHLVGMSLAAVASLWFGYHAADK